MKPKKEYVSFDKHNLRPGEEVLFEFKPERRNYMLRNIFMGKTVPFPVFLIWTVVDFGAMIGLPIATGDTWILGILIPFMAIHGAPIWIYIYGVISGVKDYAACGHIITTERIITRKSRKKPFTEYEIAKVNSLSLISVKKRAASLNIAINVSAKGHTLHSLVREDAEAAVGFFHSVKDKIEMQENADRYMPFCEACGGKTENGVCLYCGARAELRTPPRKRK